MSAPLPSIHACVVTYDNADTVADCLASIGAAASGLTLRTAVHDNGSSDGTVELVRDHFPTVELTVSSRNVGFGAAHNRLLDDSTCRYALLVNPDAALRPDALRLLLDSARDHPTDAVTAPRVEYPDGTPQPSFGSFPGLLADLRRRAHARGARARDPRTVELLNRRLERPFECDWVSGACMLVDLDAYREIGGFDEGFWLYLEDVDLCRRLRGRTVRVEPRAVCVHHEGGSAVDEETRRRAYRESRLRYERKHGSRIGAALYRLLRV